MAETDRLKVAFDSRNPDLCVRALDPCGDCGGGGVIPQFGPDAVCARCGGTGYSEQWLQITEFLDMLLAVAISRHPDEPAPEGAETQPEEERVFGELLKPLRETIERLMVRLETVNVRVDEARDHANRCVLELESRLTDLQNRVYHLERP